MLDVLLILLVPGGHSVKRDYHVSERIANLRHKLRDRPSSHSE
jgi:putative intracellular protease/amidase